MTTAHEREVAKAEAFLKENPEFKTSPRSERDSSGANVLPFFPPGPPGANVINAKGRTVEERRRSVLVERILNLMDESHADLLRRYYWEQQTQAEIGAELGGITQEAVSRRLNTAREQFELYLACYGTTDEVRTVAEADL